MWTAELINKAESPKHIDLHVQFSDGTDNFVEILKFEKSDYTDTRYKRRVAKILDGLNSFSAPADGVIDTTIPDTATQDQKDFAAWELKWESLKRANELVAAGVLTGNEPKYTALKDAVEKDFKKAVFIDLL